jgi:hypothetical protein
MRTSRDLIADELRGLGLTVALPNEHLADLRVHRRGGRRIEVQVRTVSRRSDPAYWPKARFQPRPDLYAAYLCRGSGVKGAVSCWPPRRSGPWGR